MGVADNGDAIDGENTALATPASASEKEREKDNCVIA